MGGWGMTLRILASRLLWPALFGAFVVAIHVAIASGHPMLGFNLAYLALIATVGVLERVMPHERSWLDNDGQMGPDLAHTLLNKGVVQMIVAVDVAMGVADSVPHGMGIWPTSWPVWAQVVLGLVVAEFGLYWRHRIGHEWPLMWRFHAVHHSVTRLWFFNTGRFHVVDSATGVLIGALLWFVAGAPAIVFQWVSAITAVIGILTHCNIEMRCGWLNYVFNTPNLHRWHHSTVIAEGNTNYGENLMLWDQLFGTFFNPDRRPPQVIGISEPMPATFLGQLAAPFSRNWGAPAPATQGD